jgi:hypothetical protein
LEHHGLAVLGTAKQQQIKIGLSFSLIFCITPLLLVRLRINEIVAVATQQTATGPINRFVSAMVRYEHELDKITRVMPVRLAPEQPCILLVHIYLWILRFQKKP